jgi:hypothetical protein
MRRTDVRYLQTHPVAEVSLRQLALQGHPQALHPLQFLLVEKEIAVAGQLELIAAFHRHAGEQLADVRVQDR